MRVSVIIKRFPPHHRGGYELRFQDIVGVLRRRGHEVFVVTSTAGVGRPCVDADGVRRILSFRAEVVGVRGVLMLVGESLRDSRALRGHLATDRPEVILVGNVQGLSSALWNVLRDSGVPLVLDVSNDWLRELATTHGNWFRIWEKTSRRFLSGAAKAVLRGLLDLGPRVLRTRFPGIGASRVYTTADHMREKLVEVAGDALPPVGLCPSGIRLEDFAFRPASGPPRRLLYVGRLKGIKGVHTAVEALDRLDPRFRLTIVGVRDDEAYEAELRELAGAGGRAGRVEFRPPVARAAIPELFAAHDILLFPTICEEAFSRLLLEAMAAGLSVIATPNGGTRELVEDGANGLLFEAGDPDALAEAVLRLAEDPELRRRIVERARSDVEAEYGLERSVARIERELRLAVEGAAS